MTQTILILTSKTGGGHISLAEALRDQLLTMNPHNHIEILDPQARFIHWHYRTVSRYALWLWSAEFRITNTNRRALFAHRIFTPLIEKSLQQAIDRLQPDLILTTYPFLTYEVMQVLRQQRDRIPFVMLFTDPIDVHAAWFTEKRADVTLAPSRESYQQAIECGFKPEQLHQVGWPLRAQFAQDHSMQRNTVLKRLGLNPQHFTIFLQGGGEGAAQFGQTVEHVQQIDPALQIILAAGTNQTLQERFGNTNNISVLPFTKEIAPYIAATDIVMGKAGPNMLFEAVSQGKPFLATAYIPGQEKANLAFIEDHQLGWVALKKEEQRKMIRHLMENPQNLRHYQQTVLSYRQWNQEYTDKMREILEKFLQPAEKTELIEQDNSTTNIL